MNTSVKQASARRYLWLVVLISLPAISWWGVLDDFSSEHLNASISSAGLVYGTARGINALVSLLQGTEINVPFVTFSIGEVLDPVNDLIERFSDIILLALGSLALQKILLAVVSNTIFTVLLSFVALCTGLSLFLGGRKLQSALLRSFLVIAFFRFSLGLVVLANSWVDSTFLDEGGSTTPYRHGKIPGRTAPDRHTLQKRGRSRGNCSGSSQKSDRYWSVIARKLKAN
jgi:hypothetical protein